MYRLEGTGFHDEESRVEKKNEPKYSTHVQKFIKSLKKSSIKELKDILSDNINAKKINSLCRHFKFKDSELYQIEDFILRLERNFTKSKLKNINLDILKELFYLEEEKLNYLDSTFSYDNINRFGKDFLRILNSNSLEKVKELGDISILDKDLLVSINNVDDIDPLYLKQVKYIKKIEAIISRQGLENKNLRKDVEILSKKVEELIKNSKNKELQRKMLEIEDERKEKLKEEREARSKKAEKREILKNIISELEEELVDMRDGYNDMLSRIGGYPTYTDEEYYEVKWRLDEVREELSAL